MNKALAKYLNDHLAGSVAAIELLDHLIDRNDGTDKERGFTQLRSEVEEDQKVLKQILESVGGKESSMRKATAWLTEKLGQAKFHLDDPGEGELAELEALETLGLGIQGKLALWRALPGVANRIPRLPKLDFERLQHRATEQFNRVEAQRLQAAQAALAESQ